MSPVLVTENIASGLMLLLYITKTQTLPINNGFSIKFGPLLNKDEIRPKNFGSLFAKVPQDILPELGHRGYSLTNMPKLTEFGCTNQIVRLLFPIRSCTSNDTVKKQNIDFMNIPIFKQPYEDYKVIVATAPKKLKFSRNENAKPFLIYVVIPEETDEAEGMVIPEIYFVTKHIDLNKTLNVKQNRDPVLIVDSNRTVTGFKSREILKSIKFKSKLRSIQSAVTKPTNVTGTVKNIKH